MNCRRCHHLDEVHLKTETDATKLGLGECGMPYCTCRQFADSIRMIDEEML